MNAKQLIAAVAVFAAAGSVLADDVTPFPEQVNFVSTKTRAEVKAELAQDRARDQSLKGDFYAGNPMPIKGALTREEVRKEAIQSAKNHKFNAEYDVGV